MVADVEGPVEMPGEPGSPGRLDGEPTIQIQLLGPLKISRDGVELMLPASRKVRALFAYLALAPRAVARVQLCELLWDAPNDPRGELRWCLSKIRSIADEPERRRVHTRDGTVRLDLADCLVDAAQVAGAVEQGLGTLPPKRLLALSALYGGDFLEGLEMDRNPVFDGWLLAQRRRFHGWRVALLQQLVEKAPGEEVLGYLEQWLQLAPFDHEVHENLLAALARQGRIREGEEHLATTARLFESEGVDGARLREAWRAARSKGTAAPAGLAEVPAGPSPAVVLPQEAVDSASRRASVAVMPFLDASPETSARGGIADALAHDIITRLAKLRSMFVIAQGTVFALQERSIAPEEAGRILNVDYVVSGSVRRLDKRITVTVELAETRSRRIVWAEVFNHVSDDAFLMLDEIGNQIVASIASEIETMERNRAILRPPNSLDAWEAHHRGLWHMYRFSKEENDRAQQFFKTAVKLDPTFSRAYAGLSFTHWQNAFQRWVAERGTAIDNAFEAAGHSLMADDRDPAAHWAMGRALWLRGRHDQSIEELEQTIELSPNFALGHYTLAFFHSQRGDPNSAIAFSDHSRQLSPFDPLLFGMLGVRAMALVRLGRFDEAAEWANKAARRPNAHPHILAIAALCMALAGSKERANAYVAALRKTRGDYDFSHFIGAFRLDDQGEAMFRKGAMLIGMQ